jgi:hypothetical protein
MLNHRSEPSLVNPGVFADSRRKAHHEMYAVPFLRYSAAASIQSQIAQRDPLLSAAENGYGNHADTVQARSNECQRNIEPLQN